LYAATSWWTEDQGEFQPFPGMFKGGELNSVPRHGFAVSKQEKVQHARQMACIYMWPIT
jgi:hypothetical protein